MKKFNEIKETVTGKLVEFEEKHPKASKVLKTVGAVLPAAAAFTVGILTEKAIDDAKYGDIRYSFCDQYNNDDGTTTYVYHRTPSIRELKHRDNSVDANTTRKIDSDMEDFDNAKNILNKYYGIED